MPASRLQSFFSRVGHPWQRQRVLRHEHVCEFWLPVASAWFWGEAGSAAQSLQLHVTTHAATLQSVPQAQQGHAVTLSGHHKKTIVGGELENGLFINYCKASLLTSKHVRTDLGISSSSILPFEIRGLSHSSMCLYFPVWLTCKKTHPTLPIAGYFAHVQDSLLLLVSICLRAHLFPAMRPTRLPLRRTKEAVGREIKWQPCCLYQR